MTKISIITPTYNAEKFIEKNIHSIKSQGIDNIEHILVDAMSNDDTLKIINRYKDHFSKIIIEKDKGIYDGMNKGIIASTGELVGILNADDYYDFETLSHVLKIYNLSSKKDVIIYGDMYIEYKDSKVLIRGNLSDEAFKKGKFQINHPSVFISRSLYCKIGLFNLDYATGADREFLLRAYFNKAKFLKIKKPLATFSLGGFTSSYSLKLIISRTIEEYKIFKKYYSISHAVKKSINQFYRMLRNNILYYLFGRKNFLKKRIEWLKKKND